MSLSKIINWIHRVNDYITLILQKDPVRPWSLFRHSIGVVICYWCYEASIADYFELRLFEKTHRVRRTYLTTNQARRFIKHVNGEENNRKFIDKINMFRIMGRFTKREQIFCPPDSFQEFKEFLLRHGTALYKANHTWCGTGIEVWSADDSDMAELYERSLEQPAVLDELVIQHRELARLNPDSINTVKIFTFLVDDVCHFIAAEFRMGRCGSFVDNIERGGIAANVDIKTGRLIGAAYDLQMNRYRVHPDTGVRIAGSILPNWDEVLRFTEECARACPLAFVEWDIAIRENDCVLIEANPNARNCGIQIGAFHGRKKQFQELERMYDQSVGRV